MHELEGVFLGNPAFEQRADILVFAIPIDEDYFTIWLEVLANGQTKWTLGQPRF